jgi:hypothetical protein
VAVVEFEVDDDVARQIVGLFNSGRAARIVFHVQSRRVVRVECANTWGPRRFIPTASGVYVER